MKLNWPLTKAPEVVHTFPVYPTGSKLSLFLLYGQRFQRYGLIFKIAIFGHETWPLAKLSYRCCTYTFYPKGSKVSLFSLYGQRFPRYGPFYFKIAIFGYGPWPLSYTHTPFRPQTPEGVEIELILALWTAVSEIRVNFQNCHIWAGNLSIGQSPKSYIYSLSTPGS